MRLLVSLLLFSASCSAQIGTIGIAHFGGMPSQTNDPVSMVFEHKQMQTLADGTHISNVTHESFYRDSLGRTRMEHESPMPWLGADAAMHNISVQDPVARTFTNWQTGGANVVQHQFTRSDMNPQPQRMPLPAESVRPQAPVVSPQQIQAARQRQPKTTTEQLGVQDVQGVPCDATRMTVVYPVDSQGNDRPITITTERCLSRELGRVLREVTEDPRSGTRSTTLQSVNRGEPDPSLFQPPADYTERSQSH